MEHQRPHLDRAQGDVEQGFADVLQPRQIAHPAPHAAPPAWLVKWETNRPTLLIECFAEFLGVFFYVFFGIGASAAFFVTEAAKVEGYGNLLTVGLGYGLGVVFALAAVCSTSGGHLSPCYTIAFWLFKGFPARKVPFYIISQIFGGFVGAICVYGNYKHQLDTIHTAMVAAGPAGAAAVFTPTGPAGILALFPGTGQEIRYLFLTEFMANLVLAVIVFSVIDASNFVVSLASAPFVIGLAYAVIIWAFAPASISLNTARDLGGRFACGAVYGSKCFTKNSNYTALAALVNIPATLCGAFIQTVLLSDTARKLLLHNVPPKLTEVARAHNEKNGHGEVLEANGATSLRAVTREQAGAGEGGKEKEKRDSLTKA